MVLKKNLKTKVLDAFRGIKFIEEEFFTDENGQKQGKYEKRRWFDTQSFQKGDEIEKKYSTLVLGIDDPVYGHPAFVYVSERGFYKNGKKDGLCVHFCLGEVTGLQIYKDGVCVLENWNSDGEWRKMDKHSRPVSVYKLTNQEKAYIEEHLKEMSENLNYFSPWVGKGDDKQVMNPNAYKSFER